MLSNSYLPLSEVFCILVSFLLLTPHVKSISKILVFTSSTWTAWTYHTLFFLSLSDCNTHTLKRCSRFAFSCRLKLIGTFPCSLSTTSLSLQGLIDSLSVYEKGPICQSKTGEETEGLLVGQKRVWEQLPSAV